MVGYISQVLQEHLGIQVLLHLDAQRPYYTFEYGPDLPCVAFDPVAHYAVALYKRGDCAESMDTCGKSAAYVADPYCSSRIGSIEYYSTSACQFSCRYCYLGVLPQKPSTLDVDPEPALARITDLFRRGAIAPHLTVQLIGGEPLLAWRGCAALANHVRHLADRHNTEVRFKLTTNGAAFSKAVLSQVMSLDVEITISGDGPYQSHNRAMSVGHYDHANSIRKLAEAFSPERITINSTLLSCQLLHYQEVYRYYRDLGMRHIYIGPALGGEYSESDIAQNVVGIAGLDEVCGQSREYEGNLEKMYRRLVCRDLASSTCAAGASHVVLDAEGRLSSCANLRSSDQQLALGGRYHVDNDMTCSACAFRYLCGGGCRAWRVLQGSARPDALECSTMAVRSLLAFARLVRERQRRSLP